MHERLKSNQFNTCTIVAPARNRLIIILMMCGSYSHACHNDDDEYDNSSDDDKDDGEGSPHNSSASDGYQGGANLQYTIHNIQYAMTIYVSQHAIYNIHYSNTFHCACLLLFSFLESYNQHIPKLNLTAIKQLGETAAAVPQISKIQFL